VWKSIAVYGIRGFIVPLTFPLDWHNFHKAARDETGGSFPLSGFPFYFRAVLLNFLPWSPMLLFAVTSPNLWGSGARRAKAWSTHGFHRRWLLFAAPTIMLFLLAFTSFPFNHYTLPIYPFAALLIAADLEHRLTETHRAKGFREGSDVMGWRSLWSIAAVYCCLAGIILVFSFGSDLRIVENSETTLDPAQLRLLLILLSGGWLLGGLMIYWPHRTIRQSLKPWIICHIFGAWLVILATVHLGFVGNYSPEVKAFLKQPEIQRILSTAPADRVKVEGKITTLLGAYSPIMGQSWPSFHEFKAQGSCLAWIRESDLTMLDFPHSVLARGHGVLLISQCSPTPDLSPDP